MHGAQVTLTGHKGAVTAMRYSGSGAQLATGSQDTDVILWDVAAEAGLFRLRGHTAEVTDLVGQLCAFSGISVHYFCHATGHKWQGWLQAFLEGASTLVSGSKDGYVRAWDLATQHCFQTVTGQQGEVAPPLSSMAAPELLCVKCIEIARHPAIWG
jgi:U3 small nucleolar RNA-associated protein 12